jgi:hypothetical protein
MAIAEHMNSRRPLLEVPSGEQRISCAMYLFERRV